MNYDTNIQHEGECNDCASYEREIKNLKSEIERLKGTLGSEGLKQLIEAKEILSKIRKEITEGYGFVDFAEEDSLLARINKLLNTKSDEKHDSKG